MEVISEDSALLSGLSSAQAATALRGAGPNELVPQRKAGSLWSWIVRLIADPMVILLTVAGVSYLFLGDHFDAVVVAVALVPIFGVTAILEFRSDRALERLSELSPPRARVRRDGLESDIPAWEVVPKDILLLREGDVIAADGTVLETSRLLVDESALTGESLPVEKRAGSGAEAIVLAGTIVRSGRAVALVERTGAQTEYGSIGRTLGEIRVRRSPIERSIHRVVYQVGIGVVVACAFVVGIQRWHGDPWASALIAGVSLAMAAIPEELPMVYTLYLALGAWRLAKDNALVRQLSSVETLGSTTVICVDKTGTLTFGELAMEDVFAVDGASRERVLQVARFASDTRSGDPLDAAILATVQQPNGQVREFELPFDPGRRYAAAIWRVGERRVLAVKGAYEALLARSAPMERRALDEFIEVQGSRGARVLAIAQAEVEAGDAAIAESAPLTVIGLIALADRVRPAALELILRCRSAGIRTMMITGDHPSTARAVALACGLDATTVASGEEDLATWDDDELRSRIATIDVFARVRPEQKLRIVRALHDNGDVVAMTGDGTNDALALREADIGVAMGRGGTEVARAAADLVLLDDDVTTIVRAVADGRRIFHNLRHAFSYLNSFHAPLLISAFALPLVGAPILLLPIHLIWLELIVHPTSALVFENDPAEPDLMTSPPRSPSASLLGRADWIRALLIGGTLALAVIATYLIAMHLGLTEDAARSAGIVAMIGGQTVLVFVERAGWRPIWRVPLTGNQAMLPVAIGTIASVAVAIYWTPFARALHLAPISLTVAAVALAAGVAAVLWMQPYLAIREIRRPSRS